MKVKYVLCGLGLAIGGLVVASGAKGLSYQSEVGVEFTFTPTLSVSLSSQLLTIDGLMPGSYDTSNDINITVNSNNVTGYTLSANVGSSTNTTSDLTLDANNAFECLPVGTSIPITSIGSGQWGYTVDSGTNYSGLADYASGDSTVIKSVTSPGTTVTPFKIAAKATDDQIIGNYTNEINFTVVTNYMPVTNIMQEVTSAELALMMPEEGYATVLRDARDNRQYRVAKLNDGNYWMVQNLGFNIDSGRTYTNEDTDIGWNSSTGSYDTASWTPSESTRYYSVGTWDLSWSTPVSYAPASRCWDGVLEFDTNGSLYTNAPECIIGSGYEIGNYYNWTAAVAMNSSSSYHAEDFDVDQSICPAGWTLPKSGEGVDTSGSFQYLIDEQGLTSGTSGNIQDTPTFFTYSGYWVGTGSFGAVGYYGAYWSSVSYNDWYSRSLYFNADGHVSAKSRSGRETGLSVRCVFRN